MMRAIGRTTSFKRDYKREKRTDPSVDDALVPVLELLASDHELPERLRDHALGGDWKGHRDCHVKPDLVLIYTKPKGTLTLVRLGSHAELFG
jgi:mRNA interferase YafQ